MTPFSANKHKHKKSKSIVDSIGASRCALGVKVVGDAKKVLLSTRHTLFCIVFNFEWQKW
jgi:hypothetical protein